MSFKVFQNNTALTAEDLNDVLMEQAVITFADATARNNAVPTPNQGMHCHLLSTGRTYFYSGSKWIELLPGEVSGLTARSVLVCTSTTRPSHAAGRIIYETDTKLTQVSDGTTWFPQQSGYVIGRADLSGTAGANNAIVFMNGRPVVTLPQSRRIIVHVSASVYQPNTGTMNIHIERWANGTVSSKVFGKRGIRTGGSLNDLAHYTAVFDDVVPAGTWEYRVAASATGVITGGGYIVTDPGCTNHILIQDGGPN